MNKTRRPSLQHWLICGAVAAVSLLGMGGRAQAEDALVYLEFISGRTQTGANSYTYDNYLAHALNASSTGPATITSPGTIGTFVATGHSYSYDTSAELFSAFGPGTYEFNTVVEGDPVPMPSVTSDTVFNHQSFANFSSIQNINPAVSFTFEWVNPGITTPEDFYSFILYETVSSDLVALEDYLLGGPTSFTVDGGVLKAGIEYTLILDYYSPITVTAGEYSSEVAYQSDNYVYFTPVPEPSTLLLLVAAGAGMVFFLRRRKTSAGADQ